MVQLPLALAGEGRASPRSKCGSCQAEHHLLPGHIRAKLVPSPSLPLPSAERGTSRARPSVQTPPPPSTCQLARPQISWEDEERACLRRQGAQPGGRWEPGVQPDASWTRNRL